MGGTFILKTLYRITNLLFLALLPSLITIDIFDGAIGTYLWTKEINIWLILLPIIYIILIGSFIAFLILKHKFKLKACKKFIPTITFILLGLTFLARIINITAKIHIWYFLGVWILYFISCFVYVITKKEGQSK